MANTFDNEKLAKILNLCESNPDAGLEFIERTIREKPETESDPFGKFAKANQFYYRRVQGFGK